MPSSSAAGFYNYALHLVHSEQAQTFIKEKLTEIEPLILRLCTIQQKEVGIISFREQFEQNRAQLKKYREEFEEILPKDPSSEAIRQFHHEIAEKMKQFVRELILQAMPILGEPPCSFAVIGLGSLAREEMTPYSDLEFGILTAEELNDKKYFRDLTSLLHLKVINLGETILPALAIPCLKKIHFYDNVTPRGFAFDGEGVPHKGCKTPLGNEKTFELIKTPEKFASYQGKDEQDNKWWFEKEPGLPMELQTFTYICGKPQLVKNYAEALEKKGDC